jgi:hypothetical protein
MGSKAPDEFVVPQALNLSAELVPDLPHVLHAIEGFWFMANRHLAPPWEYESPEEGNLL